MPRARGALALVALALMWGVASASAAATRGFSHALNWQTPSHSVFCGIAIAVPGTSFDPGTGGELKGDWPGLQCSAEGLPVKHDGGGDPFVQLGQGASGRARIVYLGDDDLVSGAAPVTLKAGSTWSREGLTCAVATASVSCHNGSGHGFTLRTGHFKAH